MDNERRRLAEDRRAWLRWGPYLSERAWGTVREDYSPDGDAWGFFPHDHARRAPTAGARTAWAAICDDRQRLCLAFAFWNGRDPILKERIFGLTGPEGNHGEDAKEYWWYLDSTPTHSWMRWRYHVPAGASSPTTDLVATNAPPRPPRARVRAARHRRVRRRPLLGHHRRLRQGRPRRPLRAPAVRNAGPDEATLDVLPTLWFRNTWSWGIDDRAPVARRRRRRPSSADHHELGRVACAAAASPSAVLRQRHQRRAGSGTSTAGRRTPRTASTTTSSAARRPSTRRARHQGGAALPRSPCPPGRRPRSACASRQTAATPTRTWAATLARPPGRGRRVLRRARPRRRRRPTRPCHAPGASPGCCGASSSSTTTSSAGSTATPPARAAGVAAATAATATGATSTTTTSSRCPTRGSTRGTRRGTWRSTASRWPTSTRTSPRTSCCCCAASGTCTPTASSRPTSGTSATSTRRCTRGPPCGCSRSTAARDFDFLERIFHKLLLNFTWWVNRKDADGNNVFEGGFLGLDNIGPIDRSDPPAGRRPASSSPTARSWMAMYCLDLLEIALVLAEHDPTYEDVATKFFEHFTYIATAINRRGLWDEEDGFYYDVFQLADGDRVPLRVRSIVGLLPLCGHHQPRPRDAVARLPAVRRPVRSGSSSNKPQYAANVAHATSLDAGRRPAAVDRRARPPRAGSWPPCSTSSEFLSPYGLRALSQRHRDDPYIVRIGEFSATRRLRAGRVADGLFGGNSNWRGPIWFPINYLLIEAARPLRRLPRRRLHRRAPDRLRAAAHAGRGGRRPRPAG